jgi:hypothetical protein
MREKWKDPSFREKTKDRMNDPEVKERQRAKIKDSRDLVKVRVSESWNTEEGLINRIETLLRKLEIVRGLPTNTLEIGERLETAA